VFPDRTFPSFVKQEAWAYRNLMSEADEARVWASDLMSDLIRAAKPYPHAIELVRVSLSNVCLVSSRGTCGDERGTPCREATRDWVKFLGLGSIPTYFVPPNKKAEVAIENGVKMA